MLSLLLSLSLLTFAVVIFICKASNNVQILQIVYDIVGHQVSDLIS